MDCVQFEELISEYLDGGLTREVRRDFAAHLLACRPCHLIFNDVREAIAISPQLKESQIYQGAVFAKIERRILNATTAGEMLSCRTLDALISDYFEEIIEGSYEQIFREHFAVCGDCHRLIEGIRQSLEESEAVEIPEDLYRRILAATSGYRRAASS